MGMRDADFSSQAGDDDAEDQGCDPGERRPGLDGCGTLWDFGADGLEVAQARSPSWCGQPTRAEAERSQADTLFLQGI